MRQKLLRSGAEELEYEIRNIVKKAEKLQELGIEIHWENIGDPIQKNAVLPAWIKEIITETLQDDKTFGYSHSKGELTTREFVAQRTTELGGVELDASDVLFFNGLGDAIAKMYQILKPSSRIICPSPSYSTHSSGEAAHAKKNPITYPLDPTNNWYPDIDQLYLHVKYNPNLVGILVINPDNPTGMVYPKEILEQIVDIAREFDLFIISDEIYNKITYNGATAVALAEVIGDVPGIAMKGISKEMPWPGSRCGWMEFYNRDKDKTFSRMCSALEDAKMVEVCSTTLPQVVLPKVLGDPRFDEYREEENQKIGERSKHIASILGDVPYITFNETFGAFYNTIVFKEGALKKGQFLKVENEKAAEYIKEWVDEETDWDKRFVYYLLASTGVCVVPLSSFHCDLNGFRVTMLEDNREKLKETFNIIKDAIFEYCESV